MFINNINGVTNKICFTNKVFSFFPPDIKLEWKAKQKQRELTKNQLFYYFFVFFLKIQDIRKSKTPIFERGSHKKFLGQELTIFQTSPEKQINYKEPKIFNVEKCLFGISWSVNFVTVVNNKPFNVQNLFKVNDKGTRTTSLASFWCLYR